MNKPYVVYCHTSPSGKKYIGMSKNVKRRWEANGKNYKMCTKFYNAIKKYGWENITHEILEENLTKEEAERLEEFYIKELDTINNGYNMLKSANDISEELLLQSWWHKVLFMNWDDEYEGLFSADEIHEIQGEIGQRIWDLAQENDKQQENEDWCDYLNRIDKKFYNQAKKEVLCDNYKKRKISLKYIKENECGF